MRKRSVPADADAGTLMQQLIYAWLVEGPEPWRINERALCNALLEHPGKTWCCGELIQISGLTVARAQQVLAELAMLGAVESTWGAPCATKQFHPLERLKRGVDLPCGQRVRLIDDGAEVIRNRLDGGRPRGVITAFLWEGWGSASAVWQAKRRERAWRRSR